MGGGGSLLSMCPEKIGKYKYLLLAGKCASKSPKQISPALGPKSLMRVGVNPHLSYVCHMNDQAFKCDLPG